MVMCCGDGGKCVGGDGSGGGDDRYVGGDGGRCVGGDGRSGWW